MRQSQIAGRPIVVVAIVLAFLLLVLVPRHTLRHTLWNWILRPAAFGFFLIFGMAGLRVHWGKARKNASPLESATRAFYLIFFGIVVIVSGYELVRFALTFIR